MRDTVRRMRWRKLYRLMHKITYNENIYFTAAYKMRQLGRLLSAPGATASHTKRMADKIRKEMFAIIYESPGYELTMYNYDITDKKWQYEMAAGITCDLHERMSKTPAMRSALRRVKILTNQEPHYQKRKEEDMPFGNYCSGSKTVGFSRRGLSQDMAGIMKTIAHEYTHVLQESYSTEMPSSLIQFTRNHRIANRLTPYRKRIKEIEAHAVGQNIRKDFEQLYEIYASGRE